VEAAAPVAAARAAAAAVPVGENRAVEAVAPVAAARAVEAAAPVAAARAAAQATAASSKTAERLREESPAAEICHIVTRPPPRAARCLGGWAASVAPGRRRIRAQRVPRAVPSGRPLPIRARAPSAAPIARSVVALAQAGLVEWGRRPPATRRVRLLQRSCVCRARNARAGVRAAPMVLAEPLNARRRAAPPRARSAARQGPRR
jgi:hypothetical protein